MSTRKKATCASCGGTATIEAIDNDGASYIGCATCTIDKYGAVHQSRPTIDEVAAFSDEEVAHAIVLALRVHPPADHRRALTRMVAELRAAERMKHERERETK